MAIFDYQWVSGFDNAGSLVNVEDDVPRHLSKQLFYPQGRANFDDGMVRIRADGLSYTTGFKSFTWPLNVLTYAQWAYIQTNYATGGIGLSGKMTVRTRLIGGTYANYNAILILPNPPDENKRFVALRNTELRFARAVAI